MSWIEGVTGYKRERQRKRARETERVEDESKRETSRKRTICCESDSIINTLSENDRKSKF